MYVREHAEQETIAGHGVQNPRQGKHRTDETKKKIKHEGFENDSFYKLIRL